MKKNVLLLNSLILGLFAVNVAGTQAYAEKKSEAGSTVNIKMLAGDEEEERPPVGPVDPEDEDNQGTGNKGLLTINRVPNLKFGEVNISGSDQVEYALNQMPYAQVTDVRGTSAGWTMFVRADDFTSASKDVLKGATLSLKNSIVSTMSAGKTVIPPKGNDVTLTTKNQKIMMADKNSGEGTWLQSWYKNNSDEKNSNIQLSILAGTAKANTEYSANIYWELQDAPIK
ncbi:hypothetical protein IGJ02_002194 [Enterococcus sp. DIV0724b]|uniref:WxL domain-containing protein n=1 Tax=Enterococcus sp. DIV0724b TaxID=2774694 RepID=UPI003D2FC82A